MLYSLCVLLTAEDGGGGFDFKLILAFGAVIAVMFLMPRLLRKNRQERKRLEKQYNDEVSNRLNVKSEADRILIEIVEAGREINARLDNKIRVLNKLIKDAEVLVERVEKAGTAEPGSTQDSEVSARPAEPTSATCEEATTPDIDVDSESQKKSSGRFQVNIRQKIADMAAQGRSVESIARLTRLSTAEVSLMLEMLNAKK